MAALSEIEKLEARFNENPDGRFFAPLADAYRKAGRVDDAITVLTAGLPKHPDYLSAHIVLGRCHLDKKDDGQALAAFERVLGLDSENIIALKALAEIAERVGQADDARRWLMRLLTVDPMNSEADDDLKRLGGPLDDAQAPAAAAAEEVVLDLGVASDLAEPAAPAPAWPPPPAPLALEEPAPAAAAALTDIPTLEFTPPPDTVERPAVPLETATASAGAAGDAPSGFQSFDDQLQWGAGERQSGMIHAEDIAEAERRHEATSAAIEFLEPSAPAAHAESAAPPAATPGPTRTREIVPPVAGEWSAAAESSTIEMPPVTVPRTREHQALPVAEPPLEPMAIEQGSGHGEAAAPEPATAAPPPAAPDLPLIMPEDVTPPDEMRRPSLKHAHVSPPAAEPAAAPGEPMLTETMAELYLRQGFTDQAIDVYRRLVAQRPHDAALRAKLAALEAPRPVLSAAALGAESVGAFLGRIARGSLPSAPAAPPPNPPGGPTPMDQAFAAGAEAEQAASAPNPSEGGPLGAPARPATDAFSLDQIFGASGSGGQAAQPAPPQSPPAKLGASFDEFFGAAPPAEDSVRPRESKSPRASDDDLSAFNTWLHGLRR